MSSKSSASTNNERTPSQETEPRKSTRTRKPARKPIAGTQARAQTTRKAILRAAIKIFAKKGFDGGRIDTISKASRTHDRMIYYYFGSKENLFIEVLKTVYQQMNEEEAKLNLDFSEPVSALTDLVHFMWHHYLAHPEFLTLLNTENLHQGKYLKQSGRLQDLIPPGIAMLEEILKKGVEQGIFRDDIEARDLYITIASLGYFYLSNRYTLSAFLDQDVMTEDALNRWRAHITKVILRSVQIEAAHQHPEACIADNREGAK